MPRKLKPKTRDSETSSTGHEMASGWPYGQKSSPRAVQRRTRKALQGTEERPKKAQELPRGFRMATWAQRETKSGLKKAQTCIPRYPKQAKEGTKDIQDYHIRKTWPQEPCRAQKSIKTDPPVF